MAKIKLVFSRSVMNDSALIDVANYTISGPMGASLTVTNITRRSSTAIDITVSDELSNGEIYTLSVVNLHDTNGNVIRIDRNATKFVGATGISPQVVSAVAANEQVTITFNENMGYGAEEPTFYKIAGICAVAVLSAAFAPGVTNQVILTTTEMRTGSSNFTVSVSPLMEDAVGNSMNPSFLDFVFNGVGVAPQVSAAVQVYGYTNKVTVTFNEAMGEITGSLVAAGNYAITGTSSPAVDSVAYVDPTHVTLTLGSDLVSGSHTVTVINVVDAVGNVIDAAHDDSVFTGYEKAKVSSVTRTGAVLTVVFDQDMDDAGLTTTENYVLTSDALIQPTLVIAKVNQYTVTATMTGEMKTGVDNYTLTMSNLITLDKGLGINAGYNHGHFSGAGVAPTLSGSPVATASPNRILVAFSEAMNEASMLEKSNYSFPTHPTPGDLTISSTILKDGNEVYLNLSTEMRDDGVYSLLASQSVLDAVGNPVDLAGDEELFVGHGTLPVLSSASKISGDEIDVVFNEAMDETSAETAGSYNVTTLGGANVDSAVLDGDTVTVHLTLDKEMGTGTTTVVSSATDLAGNPCTAPDNDASFDSMNWTLIATADEPSGRYGHGAGVISDSSYATYYMIYGGYDGTYPTDTWIYVGDDWDELTPDNNPGQVSMSRLCSFLLGGRESVLMFGGLTNMGVPRDQTWAWIPADDDWSNLTAFGTPPTARILHAMAYDVDNNEVVLFGGMDAAAALLGDTFTFAEISCAWTDVTPGSDPSPRKGPGMAYDETRNETVLFGGYDATGFVADTWVWNGSTWTQKSPAHSPSARMNHQMWYSAATGKIYIFGGSTAGGVVNTIWSWDGSDWTEETTLGTAPTSRYAPYSAIGISPGWDTIMLFGGTTGKLNDTWFL